MVSEEPLKALVSSGSAKIARRQCQGSIMSYKILKVSARTVELNIMMITIIMISPNGK